MPDQRRNPFEGVTDYVSELGRIRTLGVHGVDHGHATEAAERTHASAWVPTTDILARGDDLVIRVELPGVDPSDVDILLHRGVLTVAGARPAEDPDDAGAGEVSYYVRERFHGAFRRLITLPDGTEADQVEARFDDGLVEVVVHGAGEPARSTRIAVSTSDRERRGLHVRDPGHPRGGA